MQQQQKKSGQWGQQPRRRSPVSSFQHIGRMKTEDKVDRVLPDSFTPKPDHVICARGTGYWHHQGNVMYRHLIENAIPRYTKTTFRLQKSIIVSEIADAIDAWSPHSGFVKRSADGQYWVRCSTDFVREKIGQSIRDRLQDQYKSSTKSKKLRGKAIKTRVNRGLEAIVQSKPYVVGMYDSVKEQIVGKAPCSDDTIHEVFLQANTKLLETIKEDTTLMEEYKTLFLSGR